MKLVIGLIGLGGTGKGEVVKLIRQRVGGVDIELRKIVETELARANLRPSNSSLREMSTSMRMEYGQDVFAQRSIEDVRNALEHQDVVIVDSIKSPEEVTYYRHALNERFVLLAIQAMPETRFHRLKSRGRQWDFSSLSEFEWRDNIELKWGMNDALAMADYRIHNDGSVEDLHDEVDKFLDWAGLGHSVKSLYAKSDATSGGQSALPERSR